MISSFSLLLTLTEVEGDGFEPLFLLAARRAGLWPGLGEQACTDPLRWSELMGLAGEANAGKESRMTSSTAQRVPSFHLCKMS